MRMRGTGAVCGWFGVCLASACISAAADGLPGTVPLTISQPLDVLMVEGIDRFAMRALTGAAGEREQYWKRDYSTPAAYEKSVAPNRVHLSKILGVVDPRATSESLNLVAGLGHDAAIAKAEQYTVYAVTWPVLDGVTGEGLLLQPKSRPIARVMAVPDADWSPEMLVGLATGLAPTAQYARRLAEQGCQVLIPTLINRRDDFSGNPEIRMTNQPHREYVYRQAFEMGRHIIGYEVQKILAGVGQLAALNANEKQELGLGIVGVGEGGLLALAAAALDSRVEARIDAALVSGYFQPREAVWQEPIYRNVWGLLREFGDAEIASLIAPRGLVIEAAAAPEVSGPPAPRDGRGGAAPGKITTPQLDDVRREFDRARVYYEQLKLPERLHLVVSGDGNGPAVSDAALAALLKELEHDQPLKPAGKAPPDLRMEFSTESRQRRQLAELVEFTQKLVRRSARERDKFWSKASRASVSAWEQSAEFYRNYVYEEMIGKLPAPTMPPNIRSRQVLDDPAFRGYEVLIDVYPDVVAGGILLLPKDLKPNEKRPVVVCQHGLEGVPLDTISKEVDGYNYYKAFAAELARQGFITYAPQNPYRGGDRFRVLQRKSNPVGRSLFSYIIRQHERTLEFLAGLPNVDPARIGFYGLSYGGKTAVRVPPMLKGYSLSICSADYNEWVIKNTSVNDSYSYIFTGEYEMFEWNLGHVANYAELATLMTPRPFMVERGHTDGVAPDEWVAWEFAKVRRHYDFVGLPDKSEIEFFNGPHTINGKGTYEFLHRHLNWPKRAAP